MCGFQAHRASPCKRDALPTELIARTPDCRAFTRFSRPVNSSLTERSGLRRSISDPGIPNYSRSAFKMAPARLPANEGLTNRWDEHRMAHRHINPDARAGEVHARLAADLISTAFGRDYDDLVAECSGLYENLVPQIAIGNRASREEAEYMIEEVFDAMKRVLASAASRKTPATALPAVAVSLVISALEVLQEAIADGRGIRAYRNRHFAFIYKMGEYAEQAAGGARRHEDFYASLGRKIAMAVLDHEIVTDTSGAPLLAPTANTYAAIETAAIEQVVYFIGVGKDGPIKVGIAANPKSRLASLQTAHHEKLTLLAVTIGGRQQEAAYHAQFAGYRLSGEWFARHPDILAEIARLNAAETVA